MSNDSCCVCLSVPEFHAFSTSCRGAAVRSTCARDVFCPPSPPSVQRKHARNGADASAVCRDGELIWVLKLQVMAAVAVKLHALQVNSCSHSCGMREKKRSHFGAPISFQDCIMPKEPQPFMFGCSQITSRWDWKFTSVTTFNRRGIHVRRREKMKVQQKGDNESV